MYILEILNPPPKSSPHLISPFRGEECFYHTRRRIFDLMPLECISPNPLTP